jgi:hypothetical protein
MTLLMCCGLPQTGVKKSTSPGLVISTFGLAEIISCMPDGLVKIYIGYHHSVSIARSRVDSKMEVKWQNNRI